MRQTHTHTQSQIKTSTMYAHKHAHMNPVCSRSKSNVLTMMDDNDGIGVDEYTCDGGNRSLNTAIEQCNSIHENTAK